MFIIPNIYQNQITLMSLVGGGGHPL